jgi:hypothetical protein
MIFLLAEQANPSFGGNYIVWDIGVVETMTLHL